MSAKKQTTTEESKEAPPRFTFGQEVTVLNHNDVLLGRGSGPSSYVGSVAFRSLVDKRKAEYTSSTHNVVKDAIAREILARIQSSGGRFLRLKEGQTKRRKFSSGASEGIWCLVDDKVALEKCKQALRENRDKSDESHTPREATRRHQRKQQRRSESKDAATCIEEHGAETNSAEAGNQTTPAVLPTTAPAAVGAISASRCAPAPVHLPPLFMQQSPFALPQLFLMPQQATATTNLSLYQQGALCSMMGALWNQQASQYIQQVVGTSISAHPDSSASTAAKSRNGTSSGTCSVAAVPSSPASPSSPKTAANEKQDAFECSLSVTEDQYHVFTREQEELERVSMTDKEKSAALCDIFGKMCKLAPRQRKRARRDLSRSSIDFLLAQMRHELERIPDKVKPALLEAQVNARSEEFSDERLERFLRCDGMNAEAAAQRFVNYWENRRELFGPEKYLMRMSLSEALCDDLIALETGFYCLLPGVDLSGRQIIYMEPHRNTKQGYTPESMTRAIWYTIEVLAQANKDIGSGFVCIVRDTDSSIGDYDRKVFKRILQYEINSWPVKLVASHVCCTPSFVLRMVKPILFALTDKKTRTRTNVHDVAEHDVPRVLSEFGILKSNLPTELGGSIVLNPKEWIASRHAAELEEI